MNGLYKGKYIIAIYDDDDYLIDVACIPSELKNFISDDSAKSAIAHAFSGRTYKNLYFIDVTEKHNDIFAEDDEIFLEFIKEINPKMPTPLQRKLDRWGISESTYYRYKAKGALHLLEKGIKKRRKRRSDL